MAIAIVLAGGSGSRMNSDVAKQYLMLRHKEVLFYSLKTFQDNENVTGIILVTRSEDTEYCKTHIVEKYGFDKVKKICIGGKERYNSVYNGLCHVETISTDIDEEVVLIHDGARPFVSHKMINESVKMTSTKKGACTVGVPVKDTIKIVVKQDGKIIGKETPDRSTLYQIQTPQTFRYKLIMDAYEKMLMDENHNITDDTMIVEQYAEIGCVVIDGSYENIKITTPEDLEFAEKIVEKNLENF